MGQKISGVKQGIKHSWECTVWLHFDVEGYQIFSNRWREENTIVKHLKNSRQINEKNMVLLLVFEKAKDSRTGKQD